MVAAKAKGRIVGKGNKINRARVTRYVAYNKWANKPKFRKRARKELEKRYEHRKDPMTEEVTISEQAPFRQILFGRCRCGGAITYAQLTQNNQALLLVITIAGHEITSFRKVFFDGEEVIFNESTGWATGKYLNIVYKQVNLGSPSQTALSQLVTDSGGAWTSNHRQMGCAHIYLKLIWDDVVFQAGIPEITFEVDGYKVDAPGSDWYGTKDSEYWRNPIYLTSEFLADDRIGLAGHWASDIAAYTEITKQDAGYCSGTVLKKNGTEKRFILDQAIFNTSDSIRKVLETMLIPCDGFLVDFGATWYGVEIMCDRYRQPLFTLTEADILSDLKIDSVPEVTDQVFGVRGTYVGVDEDFKESSFPPVYWGIDGSVAVNNFGMDDISYPGVTSPTQAQRLAKQHLYENVHWVQVSGTFSLRAFEAGPTDVIKLSISRYGFVEKTFKVVSSQLAWVESGSGVRLLGCQLVLRETDADIYEWNPATEERNLNAAQALSLYDTSVAPPALTGMIAESGATHAYRRADGTIAPRIYASWSVPTDSFITAGGRIEIQSKLSSATSWITAGTITADDTDHYIADVMDGQYYDVRIRALNSHGAASDWATRSNIRASGTATRPGNVPWATHQSVGSYCRYRWGVVNEPDVAFYRIYINYIGGPFSSAEYYGDFTGDTVFLLQASAQFYIKAVNRSGLESQTPLASVAPVTLATGMPLGLLLALTKN